MTFKVPTAYLLTAKKKVKETSFILLQGVPASVPFDDVRRDLLKVKSQGRKQQERKGFVVC